jgi:hypothetical protein
MPGIINALDHLNTEQRRQVIDRTLIDSVAKELNDATRKAIQDKAGLYIPAGLWIIEASGPTAQRDPKTIGWTIDVPAHGRLRAFGDGEATIIQRRAVPFLDKAPWTTNLADFDFLVRIIPNEGISIELDGLLFDGNERNCPTIDSRTPPPNEQRLQKFDGDGNRTIFKYEFSGSLGDEKVRYGVVVKYADGREILQTAATITRDPRKIPPSIFKSHTVFFFAALPDDAKVLIFNASNFEHCANIGFGSGSGIPDLLRLHRITMRGCVADGLFANRQIRRLVVTDFRASGRTRRRRFDICLSRVPIIHTVIDGFDGDSFANEPNLTAENSSMFLANMHVRGSFGVASEKRDRPLLVTGRNIKSLMQHGFGERNSQIYNVSGIFTDCDFAGLEDIRESRTTFNSCRFTLALLPDLIGGNSVAQPLGISHIHPQYRADFIDCTFLAPNLTSGEYVVITAEGVLRPEVTEEPTTQFINCRGVEQLDHFVIAEGFVVIAGGSLPGRNAAIYIKREGNRGVRFIGLYNPEEWTCAALLRIEQNLRFATTIDLGGSFNAERIACVVAPILPRSEPQITWTGEITGRIKIEPPWDRISGMPGLILENSDNGVFFYDARPDFKTFGNKIYRISL